MNLFYFLPFIILILCFIIRVPIGLGIFSSCIVFFVIMGKDVGLAGEVSMSTLYSNVVLIAIPLFIFTANIMNSGKVTEYMFTFAKALVGHRRGAMAYINILVSLIFSGMTGSAMADASGIGTMELSEMKKDGYDTAFSAALTATTATVGPIFPPSIPLVIYAMLAEVSVGRLFLGGMIPAVLICLALGIYVWYISKKRNYPRGEEFTFREFLKYTWKALPALFTPVILLGGIYGGVVTATEAGALAALYALLISVFAYRVLRLKGFLIALRDTVTQTAKIIAMATGAFVLSHVVASYGISDSVTTWFLGITDNKYIFLLVANIVFLFLGMILDTGIIQFIFFPLILPVVSALGIDFVHFGVLITVNTMIGLSTPPYGMLCFIVSGLTGEPLKNVFKEAIPMVLMMMVVLFLITYVPWLVLAIPNLVMS